MEDELASGKLQFRYPPSIPPMSPWGIGVALALLFLFASVPTRSDCPKKTHQLWLTHHTKNSAEESSTYTKRLGLNCTLESQFDAVVKGSVVRHRTWCCPLANKASSSKRSIHTNNDDDDDGEPVVDVSVEEFLPWHLDRLDQELLPLDGEYAPRLAAAPEDQNWIHIYIYDTGIDIAHLVFKDVLITLDYHLPKFSSALDCHGHGTKVASVIIGYATGVVARGMGTVEAFARVHLHIVRIMGCDGRASSTEVIQALDWIQSHGVRPAIVSMSIGSSKSVAMNSMVESLVDSGDFLVVVAAGNENTDACLTSPASAAGVKAIGATTVNDYRTSYSNYGKCLTCFASGDGIYGAKMGSYNQITASSGTSFSCPIFVGSVARYMICNPSVTHPMEAFSLVMQESTYGIVGNPGSQSPNILVRIPKAENSFLPTPSASSPSTQSSTVVVGNSTTHSKIQTCLAYIIALSVWFLSD